ncbi:hypothetical protein D3C84_382900 [compost metagenome]
MGDETHVGLVDAHAEGNGGDHDQPFLVEEALLVMGPQVVGQACVVGQRREALLGEEGRHLLHLLARHAVDDAGVATAFGEEAQQLLARLVLGDDAVKDVRPVEAGEEALGVLQVQALDHLLAGTHVRGGGQRHARHIGEELGQLPQLQVLGAEIVAPLGHAVGFVDREQADLKTLQESQHARLHQALGREIEQLDLAAADALGDIPLGLGREGGVQRYRRYAQFVQGGDLVVHQCDQRRNHHRQPFAQQCWHLKTEGLAAAGRHQHQGIAPGRHAFDDRGLVAAESVVAEYVFEDALCLVEHGGLRNKPRIIRQPQRQKCPRPSVLPFAAGLALD